MQFIAARFMRNLLTFSFFKVLRPIDFWPMRTRVLSLSIKTRCCLVVSCGKRTWFIIFSHFIIGQLFMADGLRHLPILFPNSAILLASAKNRSGDEIACVSGLCESFTSRRSVYLMESSLSWFKFLLDLRTRIDHSRRENETVIIAEEIMARKVLKLMRLWR